MTELADCGHCGIGVIPTSEGCCPFCRRPTETPQKAVTSSIEGQAIFSAPSGVGNYARPLRIAGHGTYRFSCDAIEFSGYEEHRIQSLFGVLAILATAFHFYYRDHIQLRMLWFASIAFLASAPGRFFASKRHPLIVNVPWSAIRKIRAPGKSSSRQVLIDVAGIKPSGTIYLAPSIGADNFLASLPEAAQQLLKR